MLPLGGSLQEGDATDAPDRREYRLLTSVAKASLVQRMIAAAAVCAALGVIAVLLTGSVLNPWLPAVAFLFGAAFGVLYRVYRNHASPTTFIRIDGDVLLIPRCTEPRKHKAYPLADLDSVEHRGTADRGLVLLGFRKRGHVSILTSAFASKDDIGGFVDAMRGFIVRHEGTGKLEARESLSRAYTHQPPLASLCICVLLIAAHAVHRAIIDPDGGSLVYELTRVGGLSGYLLASGELFRLATAAFVHLDAMHLLVNVFVIMSFGNLLEPVVKRVNVSIVFLASALAAAICSTLFSRHIVSIGASGGAYGLVGAFLYIRFRYLDLLPARIRLNKGWILYGALLMDLGYGLSSPSIDFFTHLGGLSTGVVYAAVLSRASGIGSLAGRGWQRPALAGLVVVHLTSFGLLYLDGRGYDPVAYRERLIDRVLRDVRQPGDGLGFVRYADMLEFTVDELLDAPSLDRNRLQLARERLERVIALAPDRSAARLSAIDSRLAREEEALHPAEGVRP